jgi:uncharacterized protein YqhQ
MLSRDLRLVGKAPESADTELVTPDECAVRVGGQALPDGVLMRTDRSWAIAREDGTVETGDLPTPACRRIPVVRVVAGLAPALLLGLRGGRGRPEEAGRGRSPAPWPLIRGLIITQVVVLAADWLAGHAHLAHGWSPEVAIAAVILAIALFRAVTPAAQWRFHGSEHKAVWAHERGIDLDDVDAVLACSRVHPRCGTNLVVWMALAMGPLERLPLLAQLGATVIALAVIAEIMTVAARHPASWVTRLLQAPGAVLQRFVTTSEPTRAEQQVGCRALSACLARHSAVDRLAPFGTAS